jgi:hypothetical protein
MEIRNKFDGHFQVETEQKWITPKALEALKRFPE